MKLITRSVPALFLGISLLFGSAATAAERDAGGREPKEKPSLENLQFDPERATKSHALVYDLPAGADTGATLEVRVLRGEKLFARETIEVAAGNQRGAFVEILGQHPDVLSTLRLLESESAGTIRFEVLSGDRLLAAPSLAELEPKPGRRLTAPVGTTMRFEMMPRARKVATDGYQPDPACEEDCWSQYLACAEQACDPRGSCQMCQEYYNGCVNGCPLICVEPKDVYDVYTSWQYLGYTNLGQICVNGHAYFLIQHVERRYVYERTEHCDNSYTDVYKSTEYDYTFCKLYIGPGCFGVYPNPPGNC